MYEIIYEIIRELLMFSDKCGIKKYGQLDSSFYGVIFSKSGSQ